MALTQLRLIGFYKSITMKDDSLNVCADCGKTSHDVKHLFVCAAHPTTLTLSDSIRELSDLEAREPDGDEPY